METAADPDVTVIVPVYDGERYIGSALASIRDSYGAGLGFRFEVVVVDAGSSDATPEIVQSIAERDHRFRLVRSEHRLSAPAARNRALTEARAPFVACLDHDDLSHPGRLLRHIAELRERPDIAAVGGALTHIDGAGLPLGEPSPVGPDLDVHATRYLLPFHCPTLTSAMTYRLVALRAAGGFVEHRPYADDYHLFAALFDHGGVRMLGAPAARYRTHDTQLSRRRRAEQQLEVTLLRQRLAADVLGAPPPLDVVWAWRSATNADQATRERAVDYLDRYLERFLERFEPTGDDLVRIMDVHQRRRDRLVNGDTDPADVESPA